MKRLLLFSLACTVFLACAEDQVSHRRNFRQRLQDNPTAALEQGLKDADAVVRRYAVYQDFLQNGEEATAHWEQLLNDPAEEVQLAVVECLAKLPVQNQNRQNFGKFIVAHSKFPAVVRQASRLDAAAFNFHRENVLLKDDPTYDHIVEVKEEFTLPDNRWLLQKDVEERGHLQKWFAEDFDDSAFKSVKVGAWENQGFPDYDGVAWYRIRFQAPPKENYVGANLFFGAVDEQAWVWLNGKYVGQHAIGPEGWDQPFWLNVGEEIKWGEENLLVVRVEDSAHAGGIWKPIVLQALISR